MAKEIYRVFAGQYQNWRQFHSICLMDMKPGITFVGPSEKGVQNLGYLVGMWSYARKLHMNVESTYEFVDDVSTIDRRYLGGYTIRPYTVAERELFCEGFNRGVCETASILKEKPEPKKHLRLYLASCTTKSVKMYEDGRYFRASHVELHIRAANETRARELIDGWERELLDLQVHELLDTGEIDLSSPMYSEQESAMMSFMVNIQVDEQIDPLT